MGAASARVARHESAPDKPVQPNMAERVGGKEANPEVEIWGEPDAKGVMRVKKVRAKCHSSRGGDASHASGRRPWRSRTFAINASYMAPLRAN